MATAKKTASAADAEKMIVAFALRDHSEGDDGVTFTAGQRVELTQREFDDLAARGICAKGVFVRMKSAVEGARYSLKPHDTTWLAPHVYEAWKAAGYCEPTDDDPEVGVVLKAREDALREAVAERDAARRGRDALEKRLRESGLEMVAARAQAERLREMIAPDDDGGREMDDEAIRATVSVLIDMLPEAHEFDGTVPSSDARLI